MGINVEGGLRADVPYHIGQHLHVHSVFECHRCEGVAQVVEADVLTSRAFKYELESAVYRRGISRLSLFDGRWEYPLAGLAFLHFGENGYHIRR